MKGEGRVDWRIRRIREDGYIQFVYKYKYRYR
jgi:hypothetical protein